MRLQDYSNKIHKNCTILEPINPSERSTKHFWKIKCFCGEIFKCNLSNFLYGNTSSCGCKNTESIIKRNIENRKYNYYNYINSLTNIQLIRPVDKLKNTSRDEWIALCPLHEPPKEFIIIANQVATINSNIKSCGCLNDQKRSEHAIARNTKSRLAKGLQENEFVTERNLILRDQLFRPIKNLILKIDGYMCNSCFQLKRQLHIHHIDPIRFDFDLHIKENYFKIYDLKNLITLCKDCHDEAHNYCWSDLNYELQENFNFIVSKRKVNKDILYEYQDVKQQIEIWLDNYISKLNGELNA